MQSVAEANRLIDAAIETQNEGRWEDAERLLDEAEALLDTSDDYYLAESTLNAADEVRERSVG
jgi:hypothetical protein